MKHILASHLPPPHAHRYSTADVVQQVAHGVVGCVYAGTVKNTSTLTLVRMLSA